MKLAVVLAIALAASAAAADPRTMTHDAQVHYDKGNARYKVGDFSGAIDEFEAGRAIDAHPDFEYALGQVYRKLGDCKRAIKKYNAFLDTHPSDDEAEHVRRNIERCKVEAKDTKPDAEDDETAASSVKPAEPPAHDDATPPARHRRVTRVGSVADPFAPTATPVHDAPSRWYTDVPGGVLAGAGVAGLAVGVAYVVLADRDLSAANTASSVSRLQELSDKGHHERTIGTISVLAGSALAVGAIVRYALVARDNDHLSVAVDPKGAYVSWTGRF